MGRFNNKPIEIPEGIKIDVSGGEAKISGSKGELSFKLPNLIKVNQEGNTVSIAPVEGKGIKADNFVGLVYRKIENNIAGVSKGFEKILEIEGVGYRWNVKGSTVNLQVGFSHDVNYTLPEGVEAKADGNTLTISGIDKEKVGQAAADIKDYRPVEPYKGKGIRYKGQYVIRKAGKSGA